MEVADLIVIGSGQGGVPLAADFAKAGRNVVLFERDALGGSCINYGCTPSKAFLAAAHAAGRARQAAKLGIHAQVEVNFSAVIERVRSIRSQFNQGMYLDANNYTAGFGSSRSIVRFERVIYISLPCNYSCLPTYQTATRQCRG